ncbi:tetratricopeptide repeat protein [Mariniblastus fucicola]|uniref:Tetratricopeptide repeat protein n=1 Tax=Mariniblastus fucicola TaxID=980251 RepID=A0A5B9P9E4_9BACT|nr:tetratricopeptide repeat protein [Mariniblastus fucicola]QEG23357.1 hypothetical protein MFFC18_32550 [Mariniblastus fucicola]
MTRVLTTIFATISMMSIMAGSACAQLQRNDGNVARIVFNQDVVSQDVFDQSLFNEVSQSNQDIAIESQPPSRSSDLKSALKALMQETQQLQSSTRSPANDTTPGESGDEWSMNQRPSISSAPQDLRPAMPEEAVEGIGNTDDIVQRIELLKQIYAQKRIEEQAVSQADLQLPSRSIASAPPTTAAAETIPGNSRNSFSQRTNNRMPIPRDARAMPAPATTNAQPTEQTVSDPSRASPSNANRIFPDPVNLFELGNSLYQTGELQTALEAYSQVDRSEITAAEAVWLDFMMASCYRRMGSWENATSLYREVANQSSAPNLAKPARRWLKQLDLLSNSKSSFAQIETEISSLIETAKEHVKQ